VDDTGVIDTFASSIPNFTPEIASKILSLYPVSDFEAQAKASPYGASPQFFRAFRIIRDIDPVCPLLSIARSVLSYGEPKAYMAELNTTRLTPYWDEWGAPLGVSHLSDIPYFFNEKLVAPGDNSPAALALSANYSGSFISFAYHNSPVTKGKTTFTDWPRVFNSKSDEFAVLIIGGPYGTSPAVLGGKHLTPHNPAAVAFEKGRLVERCAYLDSVRVPKSAAKDKAGEAQIVLGHPGL